jgi:hypothetical protein
VASLIVKEQPTPTLVRRVRKRVVRLGPTEKASKGKGKGRLLNWRFKISLRSHFIIPHSILIEKLHNYVIRKYRHVGVDNNLRLTKKGDACASSDHQRSSFIITELGIIRKPW